MKIYKKTTEGRFWVNGFRILGSDFKTYSLSIFNLGVMFCWGTVKTMFENKVTPEVTFYKLI